MAELSIGDAVGSGFQLIRRRPAAVLLWGLVELALAAATAGLFGSFYLDVISQVLANAQSGATTSSPEVMGRILSMQMSSYLLSLVSMFVRTVLYCAAFRSVLRPDDSRFGYLRVGAAELFLFIILIGVYIAAIVALVVPLLVAGVLVAGLVAAHAVAAAVIVGIVASVALFVGIVYVALRFSLVGPMTVDDGKFHLFDAWALTRRHAGGLFVLALCLFAILLIGEVVVGLVALLTGISLLSSLAGGLSHIQIFFHQSPAVILASLAPFLLGAAVLWIPLTGCMFAISGAPWAKAYRDLSGPDLAATFA